MIPLDPDPVGIWFPMTETEAEFWRRKALERMRHWLREEKNANRLAVQLDKAEAALTLIAEGSWNFGNDEPGLTVMEFARRVLEEMGA